MATISILLADILVCVILILSSRHIVIASYCHHVILSSHHIVITSYCDCIVQSFCRIVLHVRLSYCHHVIFHHIISPQHLIVIASYCHRNILHYGPIRWVMWSYQIFVVEILFFSQIPLVGTFSSHNNKNQTDFGPLKLLW